MDEESGEEGLEVDRSVPEDFEFAISQSISEDETILHLLRIPFKYQFHPYIQLVKLSTACAVFLHLLFMFLSYAGWVSPNFILFVLLPDALCLASWFIIWLLYATHKTTFNVITTKRVLIASKGSQRLGLCFSEDIPVVVSREYDELFGVVLSRKPIGPYNAFYFYSGVELESFFGMTTLLNYAFEQAERFLIREDEIDLLTEFLEKKVEIMDPLEVSIWSTRRYFSTKLSTLRAGGKLLTTSTIMMSLSVPMGILMFAMVWSWFMSIMVVVSMFLCGFLANRAITSLSGDTSRLRKVGGSLVFCAINVILSFVALLQVSFFSFAMIVIVAFLLGPAVLHAIRAFAFWSSFRSLVASFLSEGRHQQPYCVVITNHMFLV
eukprot:TRINITY_DN19578_c0_g1_i1.p1 TRINITY_DN19578_c0_g1~~TRINITY_DN19578_c0_g1_i1.p1  ORF type:complete len:409 (+),score=81.23 TRINITY_DN19578_c0_g1_i1:93-1229(+)